MDDERGQRIEAKLDKIEEHVSTIKVTLASQHISLVEHIRRTELLEKDIEPLKKHVIMAAGAFKLLGAIAVMAATIEGVVALLTYIRH